MDHASSQETPWVIIKKSSQKGKIIESTDLWDTRILTIWLPDTDQILRLSPEEVAPLEDGRMYADRNMLVYLAAASRVRDLLSSKTLISLPSAVPAGSKGFLS